jgi:hypothetical protein
VKTSIHVQLGKAECEIEVEGAVDLGSVIADAAGIHEAKIERVIYQGDDTLWVKYNERCYATLVIVDLSA